MTPLHQTTKPRKIVYPESDGQPMAENTLQFRWITTIHGGIDGLFRDEPNVFVAGDLLWYPVEGDNTIRQAPDVMVAFGRPKGERGSYRQWDEGGIAPQVVFEVLSPGNRQGEMIRKFQFYERYGVEEYYIYDPDRISLEGFRRKGNALEEVPEINGSASPLLGIRFDMNEDELVIYRPDGKRFLTNRELHALAEKEERQRLEEAKRAEEERLARLQAQQRADKAEDRAGKAEERAARLAEQLKGLGIDLNGS